MRTFPIAWAVIVGLLLWAPFAGAAPPTKFNSAQTAPDVTLSNSNLTATCTDPAGGNAIANTFYGAGKYTFTFTMGTVGTNHTEIGLASSSTGFANGNYLGSDNNSIGIWSSGTVILGGSQIIGAINITYTTNSVVDFAVDLTNKLLWVRVGGGSWNGNSSYSPGGSGGYSISAMTASTLAPAVFLYASGDSVVANFSHSLGVTGFAAWSQPGGGFLFSSPW